MRPEGLETPTVRSPCHLNASVPSQLVDITSMVLTQAWKLHPNVLKRPKKPLGDLTLQHQFWVD